MNGSDQPPPPPVHILHPACGHKDRDPTLRRRWRVKTNHDDYRKIRVTTMLETGSDPATQERTPGRVCASIRSLPAACQRARCSGQRARAVPAWHAGGVVPARPRLGWRDAKGGQGLKIRVLSELETASIGQLEGFASGHRDGGEWPVTAASRWYVHGPLQW